MPYRKINGAYEWVDEDPLGLGPLGTPSFPAPGGFIAPSRDDLPSLDLTILNRNLKDLERIREETDRLVPRADDIDVSIPWGKGTSPGDRVTKATLKQLENDRQLSLDALHESGYFWDQVNPNDLGLTREDINNMSPEEKAEMYQLLEEKSLLPEGPNQNPNHPENQINQIQNQPPQQWQKEFFDKMDSVGRPQYRRQWTKDQKDRLQQKKQYETWGQPGYWDEDAFYERNKDGFLKRTEKE